MLMPDKVEALKKASNLRTENGKIYLFLTLQDKKSALQAWLKPKIKYLTSVDFGDSMSRSDVITI